MPDRTNDTATTLSFRLYFLACQSRCQSRNAGFVVGPVECSDDGWFFYRYWR